MKTHEDNPLRTKDDVTSNGYVFIDVFRTELIQIKRVSNRYFCTKISNNHNHQIEVPRGNSALISRSL